MITITPTDILAARHCGQAAATEYDPDVPGLTERGGYLLWRYAQGRSCFQSWNERQKMQEWMMKTQFGFILAGGGPTYPPEVTEDGYWKISDDPYWFEGVVTLEVMDQTIDAEFQVPFLHQSKGTYEIVLCDMHLGEVKQERWNDIVRLAIYLEEVFTYATDHHAYVRYLSPTRRVDQVINTPPGDLISIIQETLLTRTLANIDPGPWCNSRDEDSTYKCPLRQEGVCNPTLSTSD